MKQFKKIYLEIMNICNLSCSFCPPTTRPPQIMTVEEFREIAEKLRPHGRFLYLHIKGEPTMHPQLAEILAVCEALDFRVCLTTNGTLLDKVGEILFASKALHKVHISLHSIEANPYTQGNLESYLENYLNNIIDFIEKSTCIVVLRLWNQGGADALNTKIMDKLQEKFDFIRPDKIKENAFLEQGEIFQWGDLTSETREKQGFCYGLRDQIGVLVDGTVVPCCLDNNGDIPLGNIRQSTLQDIYDSPRARSIYDSFSKRERREHLCQGCGFISRFDG